MADNNSAQTPKEEARREFLVSAGKFALYTPPALMLLMHPSKNALAVSGGGNGTGGGNTPGPPQPT